ncbi:MAG: hypothetical protein WCB27_09660 [Thermoguttaceae bacterium]|jgi:hypothetical protein
MARENQGLQIALILLVMAMIVLSVTTYLGFKNYSDEFKAKEVALKAQNTAENQNRLNEERIKTLKKDIGATDTEEVDQIDGKFKDDMKAYGAGYPEDSLFYRKLLEKMRKTIDEKNADLEAAKARIPEVKNKYDEDLKAKDVQLEQYNNERKKANDDLASEQAKFQNERRRKNDEGESLQGNLAAKQKELNEARDKAKSDEQAKVAVIDKLKNRVTDQGEIIKGYTSDKVGIPNGEITWVNQRNSAVWINLGRADALTRQVSFSVFPPDVTSMTDKGSKKAKIEVTQVLGEHLSECRVVDDEVGNPVIPGDKIFTPLWSPGGKRHFALAGLMDIDGDGRSDLQTVLNIIAVNGGVVDCYISDAGKVVGQINVNTSCLILGEAPTDKSDVHQRDAFTKVLHDAEFLRLEKMQLTDLLQRMGWKNMSPVIRYGRGTNPKDFRAKPEGGVLRKSTGNVNDFQKRQPPAPKPPASAY